MNNSFKKSEAERIEENTKFCEQVSLELPHKKQVKLHLYSNYVEIIDGASRSAYIDKNQLINDLLKCHVYF